MAQARDGHASVDGPFRPTCSASSPRTAQELHRPGRVDLGTTGQKQHGSPLPVSFDIAAPLH
uniref:Uncharacterized protein n=1 Tax=Oryza nivara TaxID=4536 RepID=A0A0E0GKW3_ORYNI